ncbi:MAG: N-acetylmuramoyl-L-alanine amidase [Oscillospiraceae bacterium]|nr:N-acetylmuramoyl-L-alanine amidase [Oscillospiraceae bacterium]
MFVIRIHGKRVLFAFGAVVFFALALAVALFFTRRAVSTAATQTGTATKVLIDAGHGGEDGGAVGVEGLVEKDINLPVALKLESFMRALGFQTEMTRREDKAIYDGGAETLREKKVSDIRNRFAMMEKLGPNGLFLSIHQNKFGERNRGTQVFYSKNDPRSRILAERIQSGVVGMLQPDNQRQVKPSGTEIYLLYHAEIPAVLVECGFISNYEEAMQLKRDEYQNQMAFAIACGVIDYTANN